MVKFDYNTYEQEEKWHFKVFKHASHGAMASSEVHDSRSENRRGFTTEAEAAAAAQLFKTRIEL